MNLIASLPLQVLCQLISSRAPYSNDTNITVSNLPPISNESPPPVRPTTLPDGYIAYPEIGAAYKIVFDKVTWTQARERCNLEGAYLATVDSNEKQEFVRKIVYHTFNRTDIYVDIHVGIYRMDGEWVSLSTGTTLSNLSWASRYPTDPDCGMLEVFKKRVGVLFTRPCSTEYFYICEIPIPKDCEAQENQSALILVN